MELRQELSTPPPDLARETVRAWAVGLTEGARRIMPRFARREARRQAWASLRGLLSPVERTNGWQVADIHGATTPYGVQHLLGRAQWDADEVRDDVRPSLVEHLGDPHAVRVVEETGWRKKGQQSAGVARPESGTAGRVGHGHLGVFVPSASPQGHLLLDRERELPKEWTNDAARGQRAGIPAERPCATTPPLAPQRRKRAFDEGVPAAWVTGERVSGDHRSRRRWVEEAHHAPVLAVSGKAEVWRAGRQHQVPTILAPLGAEGWCRVRAGDGAQGPRWSDGCWLPLAAPRLPAWHRWLLVRRRVRDTTELTAYVVFAPEATAVETVGQVAGSRRTVERCFAEAKGEVGLDQE